MSKFFVVTPLDHAFGVFWRECLKEGWVTVVAESEEAFDEHFERELAAHPIYKWDRDWAIDLPIQRLMPFLGSLISDGEYGADPGEDERGAALWERLDDLQESFT